MEGRDQLIAIAAIFATLVVIHVASQGVVALA